MNNKKILKGLRFCITGKIIGFKNQKELEDFIKQLGGTITQTVSRNTDYLIYGTQTAKNIKSGQSNNQRLAKKYPHTTLITVDEFVNLLSKKVKQ